GAELPSPADQHEERRLKRVLDVGLILEHAAADAQDHRPVPGDEGLERRLVTPFQVALQQLPLGETGNRLAPEDAPEVRKRQPVIPHRRSPPQGCESLYNAGSRAFRYNFLLFAPVGNPVLPRGGRPTSAWA